MNSYTSGRVSALICLWCYSAWEEFDCISGIGNNVTSRAAIDTGLRHWLEGTFSRVRYTGRTFLSPEKFVRCV